MNTALHRQQVNDISDQVQRLEFDPLKKLK